MPSGEDCGIGDDAGDRNDPATTVGGADDGRCVRRYMLYVPTIVCRHDHDHDHDDDGNGNDHGRRNNNNSNNNDSGRVHGGGGTAGILPIWMAVHCLGCTPSTFYYLTDLAEAYGMILVIPEGLGRSFNAGRCCGYALHRNVNDVGFLENIMTTLEGRYPETVRRTFSYGMGWSNGGYLVTKAASLFRAVAPISGYQMDLPYYSAAATDQHEPRHPQPLPTAAAIGLFLHHSVDDEFVRSTGCCRDPDMPTCCCRLSDHDDECISARAHARAWARTINRCDVDGDDADGDGLDGGNNDDDGAVVTLLRKEEGRYDCWTFASDMCLANTTYCIHQRGGHFNRPSFQESFPMAGDVADFFARDACGWGGGIWRTERKSCQCSASAPGEEGTASRPSSLLYCLDDDSTIFSTRTSPSLDGGVAVHGTQASDVSDPSTNTVPQNVEYGRATTMYFFIVATAVVALCIAISHRKRRRMPGGNFRKVPTSGLALEMRSL
jgi:hypothetical protein